MAVLAFLRAYWRPLAVLIVPLLFWLHGHSTGADNMDVKWQAIFSKQQLQAANARVAATEAARKQEADWVAAFDAAATIQHEEMTNVAAHRDRLLADLRAGRLSFKPARCGVPEAPADSGQPQAAPDAGQPGLAGEELVSRLATCDEVTLERNQAVRLLEAERAETP